MILGSLSLRIPPAAVALTMAALMWLVASAWRSGRMLIPARVYVAGAIALAGLLVAVAGVTEFRKARTTVNPLDPRGASSLVRSGVYRWSRNPMYLGFAAVLLAWSVYLAHPLALLGVGGFIAYMNRFQIIPEERALHALFGDELSDYTRRVRRWL